LSHIRSNGLEVFLVHGEYAAQQVLADRIRERFGYKVIIPEYLEETFLKIGEEIRRVEFPEKAAPRIDWAYLIGDMEARLAQLRQRQPQLEAKSWVEQTELRDRILELNRDLLETISEI